MSEAVCVLSLYWRGVEDSLVDHWQNIILEKLTDMLLRD
jgi:hypothetical protein